MIVQLRGAGFVNKGAELMMHAVAERVSQWPGNHKVALKAGIGSFQQRRSVGLYHLVDVSDEIRLAKLINLTFALLPSPLRHFANFANRHDIQGVLDASGFAYSDQWGVNNTVKILKKCKLWKDSGRKLIFLPQAFGPFENRELRSMFSEVIGYADLVFSRDPQSFQYLTDLTTDNMKIAMAPDFTNLIKGIVPPSFQKTHPKMICVIPNMRMLDKTSENMAGSYKPFLISCIEYLLQKNVHPFFLIHAVGDNKDYELSLEIQKDLGIPIPIVHETNPLFIKGIIGQSYAVLSSRFHGAVSALSQSVPCLTTSWSHKYEYLLADYDSVDYLMNPAKPDDWFDQLNMIVDDDTNEAQRAKLKRLSKKQMQLSEEMWGRVEREFGI